jgi:hypothetical protein
MLVDEHHDPPVEWLLPQGFSHETKRAHKPSKIAAKVDEQARAVADPAKCAIQFTGRSLSVDAWKEFFNTGISRASVNRPLGRRR